MLLLLALIIAFRLNSSGPVAGSAVALNGAMPKAAASIPDNAATSVAHAQVEKPVIAAVATGSNASRPNAANTSAATIKSSSAFRFAPDPPDGLAKVNAALGMPLARTRIPDSTNLQIKPPIAIYELSAAEFAQGAALDAAHLTRYRYLVEAAGESVMYAEVYVDPPANGGHAMTGSGGPNQGAIARALEELSASEQTHGGSYEVRILRLLHVLTSTWSDVIWLKSDDSGSDLIYSLPPFWLSHDAKKLYTSEEFLNLIRQIILEKKQAAPPARTDGPVPPT